MKVSVALLIIALIQVSVSSAAPAESSEELVIDTPLQSSSETAHIAAYDAAPENTPDSSASSSEDAPMVKQLKIISGDKESDMRKALIDLLTIVQELAKKLGSSVEDVLGDMKLSENHIQEIEALLKDGLSVGKLGLKECEELVRVLLDGVLDLSDFLLDHPWILRILLKVLLGEVTGGAGFVPSIFFGGLDILELILGI